MTLEATVVCFDNSEYSRNQDFPHSRLISQQQAAAALANKKFNSNAENTVGLLLLAGDIKGQMATGCSYVAPCHMEVAPTGVSSRISTAIYDIVSGGYVDVLNGISTAQLALKHRLNRNQRQRIVLFVCSPVTNDIDDIKKVAALLKKNNVSIDVVSFGGADLVERNREKLQTLHSVANFNNTSKYVECLKGTSLEDAVIDGLCEGGAMGNMEEDPELMMAIRMSLEEERQRVARAQGAQGGQATAEAAPAAAPVAPVAPQQSGDVPTVEQIMGMDIDEDLREALLLSLSDSQTAAPAATEVPAAAVPAPEEDEDFQSAQEDKEDVDYRELAIARLLEFMPEFDVSDPDNEETIEDLALQIREEMENESE